VSTAQAQPLSTLDSSQNLLSRIQDAIAEARDVACQFLLRPVRAERKAADRTLVTEADRVINRTLRNRLLRDGEGWLSEEDADDLSRLEKHRVWIVDPLDGTKEFVAGIPEWSISIAVVENGLAVAGGVCNPATGETFVGSKGAGITYNGTPTRSSERNALQGATVLASRSEVGRGEWACFQNAPFHVIPMGSVAYKLARVAVGLADATWTLSPKNEWDVAAGVALVEAGGGHVEFLPGLRPFFNEESTLLRGLFACGPGLRKQTSGLLAALSRPE